MFNTIEEALEAYRQELRSYVEFRSNVYVRYGTNEALRLPSTQLRILVEWNTKISAMETVLGLTEQEIKDISSKI